MPRAAREIWSPAKRSIIGEWRAWAKKYPETAKGDTALSEFYSHLEKERAELLAFSAANKPETIRGWLTEESLIT